MAPKDLIYRLRGIHGMIARSERDRASGALTALIFDIDRDAKVEEIQHFAQVCSTEHCPLDLPRALRELADSMEPF